MLTPNSPSGAATCATDLVEMRPPAMRASPQHPPERFKRPRHRLAGAALSTSPQPRRKQSQSRSYDPVYPHAWVTAYK